MKRFLTLLLAALIVSGCAKQTEKQPTTAELVPHVVTIPPLAKGAVDAVGGEQAWADTQVILCECTARFFRPDGTFYLTRQRHAVYPWSDSIRIYAPEPQGTFVWQLSGDDFTLLEGSPQQAAALPITLCDPYIARLIWNVMASPASIATQTDPNSTIILGQETKIEGLWHSPLTLNNDLTGYMSKDSGILDIYTLETSGKNVYLMARGYDYRTIQKTGVVVPGKIEIFSADSVTSAVRRRIIEFDYHTLDSVSFSFEGPRPTTDVVLPPKTGEK